MKYHVSGDEEFRLMREDKQAICDAFCNTLRMTSALGHPFGNPLVELKYLPNGNGMYSEVVRPVFEDGTGNDGRYDVNVSMDSGVAMIMDVVRQFISRNY